MVAFAIGISMMVVGVLGLLFSLYPEIHHDVVLEELVELDPDEVVVWDLVSIVLGKGISDVLELRIAINTTSVPMLLMALSPDEYEVFEQVGHVDARFKWSLTSTRGEFVLTEGARVRFLVLKNMASELAIVGLRVMAEWARRPYLNLILPFTLVIIIGLATCLATYRGLLVFLISRYPDEARGSACLIS